MVLESLDKINIKNLSIEEPERTEELPFDPEGEITAKDWQGLKYELKYLRKRNDWLDFSRIAMNMMLIFLEKAKELNLDEEVWQKMKISLGANKDAGDWQAFAEKAIAMKTLFPERIKELGLDKAYRGESKWFDERLRSYNWELIPKAVMLIKTLFPEKTQMLTIDDGAWQQMKKQLERYREEERWESFSEYAMIMKILAPIKFSELEFDESTWKNMKDRLDILRDFNELRFSKHALAMKILVSQEVRITNKGLEIIMPKPKPEFKKETPPLPETRKF